MSRAKWRRKVIVGYARVSTDGQTLDAQHASLRAAGADKVFAEKVSGAVTDRKALAKAIAALAAGDVLLVTRLGPASSKHSGPAEYPSCSCRTWRQVQIACRYVGRHHHAAWRVDDYDPGGAGNRRAALDPISDRRRAPEGAGSRCEVRPEAEAIGFSDRGSLGSQSRGRAV